MLAKSVVFLAVCACAVILPVINCGKTKLHNNHVERRHHSKGLEREFVSRRLEDSLLEVKVSHRGVYVADTLTTDQQHEGLFLRQISNGKKLIQAIFDGKDSLVDCDILPDNEDVVKFVAGFFKGVYHKGVLESAAERFENSTLTIEPLTRKLHKLHYRDMTNFKKVKLACKAWMTQEKEYLKKERHIDVDKLSEIRPHNLLLKKKRVDAAELEDTTKTDHHSRSKRSMWIYPGTNWCGHGNTAKAYEDLGASRDTDKCCRLHDHCPTTIEGFTTKFNFFNFRFNTLSHCHCDAKFRACLKAISTSTAQMVGKLYFNYVGTKCFMFKPQRVCEKRSWWGRCVKYQEIKTAVVNYSENY